MSEQPRESLIQYQEVGMINATEAAKITNTLAAKKKAGAPTFEAKLSTVDMLNAILPPRVWTHDGKHYVQYVSHNPASRDDVANLQKLLDERLLARQARESGIDPIREELHSQCFDEIIRQVTIDCPERGFLLMRVRDELKMTIAAYQTLYKSSVTFGMRKQIQAEQGKSDLENKIVDLEKQKEILQERLTELKNKKEAIEKRFAEKRTAAENKRQGEIDFLKYQGQHLENFLKSIESK